MNDMPQSVEIKKFIVQPRKETLAANIAAQLKSMIFRKKLKTGDKLPPERELASLFNVSRVVIKQALLSLEQSGFIETKRGYKGGFFIKFDFAKPITAFMEAMQNNGNLCISHFLDVRRALECAALRSVFNRTDKLDFSALIDINDQFLKPENRSQHAEINMSFHIALADLAENPLITHLLRSVITVVFSYPGPTISTRFIKNAHIEHQNILSAIEKQDLELAERLLIHNVDLVAMDDI